MKISELKERKKELGYSNKMVSDISGVPLSTVQKIFGSATSAPRYETLCKLERALFPADRDLRIGDPYYTPSGSMYRMMVEDPVEAYSCESFYGYDRDYAAYGKRQGEYTIYDYLALPDDVRMELIDGILYDMASPTKVHQTIILQVLLQIEAAIDSLCGDCMAFISPLDVQFEADDMRDCVQPDLIIVCDKEKYNNSTGRIIGSPDFVMEVLSVSTRGKDRVVKLNKYGQKGVKEYWIVDPEYMEVHVYYFQSGFGARIYTFDDVIPISISGGSVSVDFAAVTRVLRERLGFGSSAGRKDGMSDQNSRENGSPGSGAGSSAV